MLVAQTFQVPLAAGLSQKADPRALAAPGLSRLVDGQFDELGGIQTRKPYGLPAGGLIDCRRTFENGDELLVFTRDALYSRDAQSGAWVSKGTHLAVKVAEETRFATTGDQVDCDRAELGGYTFFSWHEGTTGYVAAINTSTGAVTLAPHALSGFRRIRLTALETKILLSFHDGVNGVYCYALNPASPATALAGSSSTVLTGTGAATYFDVCKVPGADQAVFAIRRNTTTSYGLAVVSADLTVSSTTKARTCDGPIAVSATSTHVQVIRANGTNIQGDYLTLALADVTTAQAVGTASGTVNQIAAAHRSVADGGAYRCYAFWSASEATGSASWESRVNWVDTAGALGTESTFVRQLGIASRAFSHDGRVFVWTAFAGAGTFPSPAYGAQLQNTYFLYRDDAFLAAKSTAARASGFASSTGCLPGVTSAGSMHAFCGGERRVIPLGSAQSGYGARVPRDIAVTFDSDEARRCVRLGQTLYITGGEIKQYDGVRLTEVGFHLFPWDLALAQSGVTGLPDGSYAYTLTNRWSNGRGEQERSASLIAAVEEVTGGPKTIAVGSIPPLYVTHKTGIAFEVWRTNVNPTEDSPYYLVTSPDPNDTGLSANEYIVNDTTLTVLPTLGDVMEDDTAASKEPNPWNGAVLEPLAPPAATIIAASADRLFLAGVAGDPHRVWYSRLRGDGEIASFHDALTVAVPPTGGAITALAFLNETLIVFKETAIYALPGDGFDNLGGGGNYGPARLLSADVGAVSAEAVALMPAGLLFKSSKGWYLLNRGWSVEYVGGSVCDYDAETVVAVHLVETQHQVRCLTTSRMLVWDYLAQQWAEWSVDDGVHACMWNGAHVYLTATGPRTQRTDYTGVDYGLDVETAWIPLGGPGWGRVWKAIVLGEYRSACGVRIRLARNYSDAYFQDKTWSPSPTTVGGPLQVKHGPSIQEMEAIKIRITAVAPDGGVPDGEALKLTRLSLELGLERGIRPLRAAQAQ